MRTFLFFILTMFRLPVFGADTLTNKSVIALHRAHIGSEVIKAKIQTSPCVFDLSTDGLVSLKSAGIPDDVIAAMVGKPTAASNTATTLAPGIYLVDSATGSLVELESAVMTNAKAGGIGEAMKRRLVSGLINAKTKASIDGARAAQRASRKPTFRFVFEPGMHQFSSNPFVQAQSPKDFMLVRLTPTGNAREIVTGKHNSVSVDFGVEESSKVPVTFHKTEDGVYLVTVDAPLPPGEYGFMFATYAMYASFSKMFDFGVD